jgi:hypothetical protein
MALSNELFGQIARFTFGYHPAHNITTEDIENNIEIEELPGDRPSKLRDVPRPQLIRLGRQEFRFSIGRMTALVPALTHFVVLA